MPPRKRSYTQSLLTSQQGEVLKVGFLRKKGHFRKNWLDRWFVLTTEGLYYYKNRSDTRPLGVIPLFGSSAKEDTLQKHQNVLTCYTAEGKDYPVEASTRDEMLVWIQALEDAAKKRTERPADSVANPSVNPGSASSKDGDDQPSQKHRADDDDDSDG
ncbi:hypothetical protein EMCRGX_G034551 [Ephydatia muelleri]